MVEDIKFLFVISTAHDKDPASEILFPLGAAYVASALKDVGVEVDVLNFDLDRNKAITPSEEIIDCIVKNKYDMVGIGFVAARYNLIKDILKAIRIGCNEVGAWMILGQHGPSAEPEFMLKETGADFVVRGEGERAIKYLVKKRRSREPVERIIDKQLIRDLDSISTPDWNVFSLEKYIVPSTRLHYQQEDKKTVSLITSRGCIGRCSFCFRIEKGYRTRSINHVLEEINILHECYGVDFVNFYDEMIVATEKRMKELCEGLSSLPFDLQWYAPSRVEICQNIDNVKMMKDSGCTGLSIGFESMDDGVLRRLRKMVTSEHNTIAIENCLKAGLPVGLNILWNLPGDTIESLWKNVDFIMKYSKWQECRTIKPVTPYPGCRLYYDAIRDGKLGGPKDFYERYTNLDRITVNFTDLSEDIMYENLYEANCKLIDAFINNTDRSEVHYSLDGEGMKKEFYKLYFENGYSEFRGVR